MLKHFLIVVDAARVDNDALAHTLELARAAGARVTLLRLLEQPTGRSRFVDPVDWYMRKIEAETSLNELGQTLRESGFQAQTALLESRQSEHVLQFARSNEVDLVVLTRPAEGIGDLTHELMKRTTIPLLALRANGGGAPACYRKILVPLDGSQRAEFTLPLAANLAQTCDAQIVLAHVIRKPEMPRRAPPTPEELELSERIVESNRSEATRYLEQVASRLPGSVETRLLVNESIPSALHSLIEQEGIDLIVLSAHGYSGAPQWPYGSVANSLISYSMKPVLVVQDLPAAEATPPQAVARSGSKVR